MKIKLAFYISILTMFLATTAMGSGFSLTSMLDTIAPPDNPSYLSETGLQTGRLNRNGTVATCGAPKANPGLLSTTGDRRYDQYRFVALSTGCLTVTFSTTSSNTLFSAAYNENGLNPANPEANYLADPGASPTTGIPTRTFSFNVTAGEVFHLVVSEVDTDGGIGVTYTLNLDGVSVIPDVATQTETIDTTLPAREPATTLATSGLQTGRISRNGLVSTCDSPKPNPGIFTSTGARRADLYRFLPATSGCAIVSVAEMGTERVQVVAYDENGFVPGDPAANYLADPGLSVNENTVTFSFLFKKVFPLTSWFTKSIPEQVPERNTN